MINTLLTYCGIDVNANLIEGSVKHKREQQLLVFYVSLSIATSIVAFIFLFYYTLNNYLLSILLTIFGAAFLLNMYRLVFSISIGELDKRSSLFDIIFFVAKRSLIIVVLAVLCSISLQSIILEPVFRENLNTYKEKINNDYRLMLQSTTFQEKNKLRIEFEETKNYLHDLERDNEISILESKLNDELSTISSKEADLLNNHKIEINNTPLLMARMKILINDFSLLFLIITISTIVIYLYPIYYYVRSDAFSFYDRKCIELQNQIIVSEFQNFKNKYTEAFINSIGEEVYFNSKYEDPPFNLIPKKPNFQKLTKGSLASWYKNFVKND